MSRVKPGINDLKTVNPELAREWHPTKNGDLKPSGITANNSNKVWWKCKYGHEWEATVGSRNKGAGCPYCAGQRAIAGVNDLETLFPEIAKEWHPKKNGALKPCDVMPKTMKHVWWLGKCGHEWEASVLRRTAGDRCPYCSGRRVLKGFNDLATVRPDIASEWNDSKNQDLKPNEVTSHSGKKVWWKCLKGHEWQATIASRTDGCGCPICSNRKVKKGYNDLETLYPELAKEWHPDKNDALKPSQITPGSSIKVWWKCSKGHEWQASITARTGKHLGCPYCSGKRALSGFNDLQTLNPNLASEWHPTKNDDLKPSDVTQYSGKKVWWKCPQGHEWIAPISNRSRGANCPKCSHPHERKTNEEFLNDLKRIDSTVIPLEPYIDKKTKIKVRCKTCGYEWLITPGSILNAPKRCPQCWKKRQGKDRLKTDEDFKRDLYAINPTITPLEHYTNSKHKILCKCELCGNQWKATPNSLLRGNGCPGCSHSQTSYVEQCIYEAMSLRLGNGEVVSRDRSVIGRELDIYIPKNRIAIEYGAWYWHRNKIDNDKKKIDLCEQKGIQLIEIYDAFPQGEDAPFDNNCYIFPSPLGIPQNKAELKGLLDHLLALACADNLSLNEFNAISLSAYKHSRRKTTEEFKAELKAVNDNILVMGEYKSSDEKIKVKCKECGFEWNSVAGNLLSGYGCPKCSAKRGSIKRRKNNEKFVKELQENNPNIELLSPYVTNKVKVKVRCKTCGHVWLANPGHLVKGHGCPKCAGRNQGKVICVETGAVYANYYQAARAVGLKGSAQIKKSCENPSSTSGGFHWRLYEKRESR